MARGGSGLCLWRDRRVSYCTGRNPGVLTIFMHGVKGNHLGDNNSIEGEGIDTQLTLLRLLGFSEK